MINESWITPPPVLPQLLKETSQLGFAMASDLLTGNLLRTLVATKPGGNVLELGTGTGCGTAWLLEGMDADSRLITVENDRQAVAVAQRHLSHDARLTFHIGDGGEFLTAIQNQAGSFDLIFADTWPGKYTHLDETLTLLKRGGIYLIDDMLPQPNWPTNHPPKVTKLIEMLEKRQDLRLTTMQWSTGLILAVKI
ncbi:MAG: class I SAM-dependent methyltransferase [Caldilineaceae bacterium]